jgi:hypothetical protein
MVQYLAPLRYLVQSLWYSLPTHCSPSCRAGNLLWLEQESASIISWAPAALPVHPCGTPHTTECTKAACYKTDCTKLRSSSSVTAWISYFLLLQLSFEILRGWLPRAPPSFLAMRRFTFHTLHAFPSFFLSQPSCCLPSVCSAGWQMWLMPCRPW